MKKLFFIIGLFFSLSAMAQPTNYTKINMRYRWLSGMFDSALYVPRYNGTPSGVRVNETSVFDGMVAMDTTNNRLYIYSGGAWVRLANYSEIPAVTNIYNSDGTIPGQRVVTIPDGSELQFFLDVVGKFNVTNDAGDTIIYAVGNSGLFLPSIPTVSSTTRRKVALIDTATGKVERIDPASLVTTPTLQQVITAGSTLTTDNTIGGGGNTLNINNLWGLYIETGNGRGIVMDDEDGEPDEVRIYQTVNSANESAVELTESSVVLRTLKDWRENDLSVKNDSIFFRPSFGQMNIDSLRTWSGISDTTHKKPMTWDTRNGRWEYAANWYGAGGGGGADSLVALLDVDISSVKKGQFIYYDSLSGKFKNGFDNDRRMNVAEFWEDFIFMNPGPTQFNTRCSGGGCGVWNTPPTSAAGTRRPGVVQMYTGDVSSTAVASIDQATWGNYGFFFREGYHNGEIKYSSSFQVSHLATVSEDFEIYMGLQDSYNTEPTNGVYWKYKRSTYGDSLVLVSANSGTRSQVASTFLLTAGTWVKVEFTINADATEIRGYINGTEITAGSGSYPITTNISTSGAYPYLPPVSLIKKTAGTTGRSLYVDYVGVRQIVPNGR